MLGEGETDRVYCTLVTESGRVQTQERGAPGRAPDPAETGAWAYAESPSSEAGASLFSSLESEAGASLFSSFGSLAGSSLSSSLSASWLGSSNDFGASNWAHLEY